jgi:hypothetical protein
MPSRASVAVAFERPLGLAQGVAFGDRLPFVVVGLAPCGGQLDLGASVLEVHTERHEGGAAVLERAAELDDLLVVQQQLARPLRIDFTSGPLSTIPHSYESSTK